MTDAHELEWHDLDEYAEITVSRAGRSHRVRVQVSTTEDGTEAWDDATATRAIVAFENLEAERRQREEAAQRADP